MTTLDFCDGTGDLPGHEGRTTSRRLMVEQNTVGGVHAVSFTVIEDNPEGVKLGNTIRRSWVEGSHLSLRNLPDLPVEFRGGGLVKLGEID